MITENIALHIGIDWVNDWNSHDLDRVMRHYADDIHFTSPFVIKINNDPTGVINSKPALRVYFERALNAYPDLHFELYCILSSVNSIVVYYKSVNNLFAAELMELNEEGKVVKVVAHYCSQ